MEQNMDEIGKQQFWEIGEETIETVTYNEQLCYIGSVTSTTYFRSKNAVAWLEH